MNNKEYVCSIKPLSLVENKYNNKLTNFISALLDNGNVLKLNDFRYKYVSFIQIAVGKNITQNE